jgi:hypothetical protein
MTPRRIISQWQRLPASPDLPVTPMTRVWFIEVRDGGKWRRLDQRFARKEQASEEVERLEWREAKREGV